MNLVPTFVKVSEKTKNYLGLSNGELFRMRSKKLKKELNIKYEKINLSNFQLFELNSQIKTMSSNPSQFFKIANYLENLLLNSEHKLDKNRKNKLSKLINEKNMSYNKIQLINWTTEKIPEEVEDLLALGKNLGIGSCKDNNKEIFKELNGLFEKFELKVRKAGVPEVQIVCLKNHTVLTGTNIPECKTFDNRVKSLKIFSTITAIYLY